MTEKETAQQVLLQIYQAAINEMANEQLEDWKKEHGYEGDDSCVATILKHLNYAYTDFLWQYNKGTGKIWHTIKI